MTKTIRLVKGREQSVLRQHPWIFSRAIQTPVDHIADGETIKVLDQKGNYLGTGHYQNSSLAVRLITFQDVEIDGAFWKERLMRAAQFRLGLNILQNGTDAFRLVHGEGDQLPGLIIDVYRDVAVVQAHSIGMYEARHQIAEALVSLKQLSINSVFCKSHDALPSNFAHSVSDEWLVGNAIENLIIHEGGIRCYIDVVTGQKTGFFLDQRENRNLVRRYSLDASVLNCFSYSGGFSLYALDGGASHVVSIDSSGPALEALQRNLSMTPYGDRHETIKDNVLTYLTNTDRLFDIVIIDPPAFAKSLSKRHNAIQAYKRLNMMAMARVKPGGLLFTFSCSQVVDRLMFHNTVVAAAIESGRFARVAHEMSQGPDHPVSIFHPEGHYLKGLALHIE